MNFVKFYIFILIFPKSYAVPNIITWEKLGFGIITEKRNNIRILNGEKDIQYRFLYSFASPEKVSLFFLLSNPYSYWAFYFCIIKSNC